MDDANTKAYFQISKFQKKTTCLQKFMFVAYFSIALFELKTGCKNN